MINIEWLIKYEHEGTKLDFKKEQYHKEKYTDLIKDIMSMANTPVEGNSYIIVGVKEIPDGTKEYFSISREEFVDQATYQQIIRENIEPNIDFSYFPIELNGNLLAVFEINKCDNPPYMMKKDYKTLKKGECFIRRGSQQERIIRRDLDEILHFKSEIYFNDKVSIGFNKNLDQQLTINGVSEVKLPSQKAKEKIELILRERIEESKIGLVEQFNSVGFRMPKFRTPFQSVPYEERETEELEKNLENIKQTYYDNDWYYIGEEMSTKINLIMRNDGSKYLEDVSIELKIPNESVKVMDRIYKEPESGSDLFAYKVLPDTPIYYPNVIEKDGYYLVQEDIGALKHQQDTEVFNEHIRIYFGTKSINQSFKWSYTIYAKNLPNPITGELKINVI